MAEISLYIMEQATPVTIEKNSFPTYRGKPLIRSGNTLYYGDMADEFVVMLQIQSTKKFGDFDIADKVTVQLMNTNPEMRNKDRIVKRSEKDSLYKAMDVGSIWLERALK